MTPLHVAVEIACCIAALAALRRSLPVALTLALSADLDVARELLAVLILRPERARLLALAGGSELHRAPFAEAVRALYHVEQAGYLAQGALVIGLAAIVCLGRSGRQKAKAPRSSRGFDARRFDFPAPSRAEKGRTGLLLIANSQDAAPSPTTPVAGDRDSLTVYGSHDTRGVKLSVAATVLAWLAVAALTSVAYPALSGATSALYSLEYVYRAWHALVALASGLAWATWACRRLPRTPAITAVAILATAELLVAGAGPYAWGGPHGVWTAGRWELARVIYLAAYSATAIVFLRAEHLNHRRRRHERTQAEP